MELKILSPQEGGFIREIQWNNMELKAEIEEKMQEYKSLAFTEDTIKEAKADRAKLNKLRTAFEDERKRIKKLCMAPYDAFEKQVKELIALIDEPIRLIDGQIKEVEEKRRNDKRREIEALFPSIGFQPFVTFDMIWDDKWLNATVSMAKIEEQMKSQLYKIGNEVRNFRNSALKPWKHIRRHWILQKRSRSGSGFQKSRSGKNFTKRSRSVRLRN